MVTSTQLTGFHYFHQQNWAPHAFHLHARPLIDCVATSSCCCHLSNLKSIFPNRCLSPHAVGIILLKYSTEFSACLELTVRSYHGLATLPNALTCAGWWVALKCTPLSGMSVLFVLSTDVWSLFIKLPDACSYLHSLYSSDGVKFTCRRCARICSELWGIPTRDAFQR